MSEDGFRILGKFASLEEAALAAGVEEALLDPGAEDLVWRGPVRVGCEPTPHDKYQVGENLTSDDPLYSGPRPPWYAVYFHDGCEVWQRDFDTKEAAQEACDDDWKGRSGE